MNNSQESSVSDAERSPPVSAPVGTRSRGPRLRKALLEQLSPLPFGSRTLSDVLDLRVDLDTLTELDAEAVLGQLDALVLGQKR